jgi:hypothetical protein
MKNTREWVGGGLPNLYYYVDLTGRIVGETSITGTGNSMKFSCVTYPNPSDSISLGMYISSEKAKMAIERYWSKEDDVYDMINERMLGK